MSDFDDKGPQRIATDLFPPREPSHLDHDGRRRIAVWTFLALFVVVALLVLRVLTGKPF